MPSDFFGACCASFAGASGAAFGFEAGGVVAGGVEVGAEGGVVVAGVLCVTSAAVAATGELAPDAFTSLEARAASRPAFATMLSSAELLF
jgi:hypothetical protein